MLLDKRSTNKSVVKLPFTLRTNCTGFHDMSFQGPVRPFSSVRLQKTYQNASSEPPFDKLPAVKESELTACLSNIESLGVIA